MDLNQLAIDITEAEGKAVSVDLAQVKEVQRCLGERLGRGPLGDLHAFVDHYAAEPTPVAILADGDDWCGLYLDGELVSEGHHIMLDMVREEMAERGFTRFWPVIERRSVDQTWLEERGDLPDRIEEVRWSE